MTFTILRNLIHDTSQCTRRTLHRPACITFFASKRLVSYLGCQQARCLWPSHCQQDHTSSAASISCCSHERLLCSLTSGWKQFRSRVFWGSLRTLACRLRWRLSLSWRLALACRRMALGWRLADSVKGVPDQASTLTESETRQCSKTGYCMLYMLHLTGN